MSTQNWIALAFAIAGLISAIVAARYWLRASRMKSPEPTQTFASDVPVFMLMATQHVMIASAKLNAKAAIWTGIAAVLSTLGSVIGLA
mgnify:CR=1 FL=1|jgi:hypothetical protein